MKYNIGDKVFDFIWKKEWEVIAIAGDYLKLERHTKTIFGKDKKIVKWDWEVGYDIIINKQ